ncbi:reverse transcriptase domain-containing protein [Pectinatus frisingensis]|uniref:reverse transcriptase domain-containing protein n=1 Tax=Pectinatus frisingensis TaxID=865 RepID=UPI0018C74742|nr:reverse transcriptase domain-containing protein [Pectinatus frisingensis]
MKITEYGIKDRQLQKEGHAQKASAEQKEYEQASGHKRITENNTVIAKHQGSRLLEKILERDNMNLAYLLEHGIYAKTPQGVPQGGPLSPLLSNIMLNELDKEITRRGHEFIRYADDCVILCKSRKSAERTLENLLPFIERKLFLKVNQEKTKLAHISQIKYLGYALYRSKGKYKLRIHPKSIAKMKGKVRVLTARSNGWSNKGRKDKINQFVRGWVQYFRLADMKGMLREIDKWVRNRIRLIYWKQWKRIRTRFEKLKQFGIEAREAWKFANTRKGLWRTVHSPILSKSLGNKEIASLGYMTMTDYYLKVCEN